MADIKLHSGFAAVGGKTESAVKAKYPNGINLTASGRKVVMADTGAGIIVPVSTSVSKALPVPAMGVAGAAGVAKASAAGQVVYSVSGGSNQSSGGGASNAKHEMISPYDLEPTHNQTKSRRQMDKFVKDVQRDGEIREPLKYVEYKGKKYVVDGHHRLIAAKKLGIKNIPVEKVNLPYGGYKTVDDLRFDYY